MDLARAIAAPAVLEAFLARGRSQAARPCPPAEARHSLTEETTAPAAADSTPTTAGISQPTP